MIQPAVVRDVLVSDRLITAEFEDGREASVPAAWSDRLARATATAREHFVTDSDGMVVAWPDIDGHIGVWTMPGRARGGGDDVLALREQDRLGRGCDHRAGRAGSPGCKNSCPLQADQVFQDALRHADERRHADVLVQLGPVDAGATLRHHVVEELRRVGASEPWEFSQWRADFGAVGEHHVEAVGMMA